MTPPVWPYPFWIAHRGAGRRAPENTLAAFREGAARGFGMFECDVKLSADDVPFLLHDSELERTTSGVGRAGSHPWAALSRLDAGAWLGAAWAGEPLPTLEAIAHFVLANGFVVNLEIKPTPGTEVHTGHVVARAAAALWSASLPAPLLSSFSVPALASAAASAPALPRALLLDELWEGCLQTAVALGCVAVVAESGLVDAALVEHLAASGLKTLAYTVNEAALADRLRRAGVAGLITDEVELFGALSRRGP
jgi:glycerophosphoryl diester phosphodiesterase